MRVQRPGVRRAAGELARLRADLQAARAGRYPSILVVEIFTDDDGPAALGYVKDLEAIFRRVSPETAVVVLQPDARRPPGPIPPWTPGRRAFFDWHPTPEEWRGQRADAAPAERLEPVRAEQSEPPLPRLARMIADRHGESI